MFVCEHTFDAFANNAGNFLIAQTSQRDRHKIPKSHQNALCSNWRESTGARPVQLTSEIIWYKVEKKTPDYVMLLRGGEASHLDADSSKRYRG
jgi:predicted peptidase